MCVLCASCYEMTLLRVLWDILCMLCGSVGCVVCTVRKPCAAHVVAVWCMGCVVGCGPCSVVDVFGSVWL